MWDGAFSRRMAGRANFRVIYSKNIWNVAITVLPFIFPNVPNQVTSFGGTEGRRRFAPFPFSVRRWRFYSIFIQYSGAHLRARRRFSFWFFSHSGPCEIFKGKNRQEHKRRVKTKSNQHTSLALEWKSPDVTATKICSAIFLLHQTAILFLPLIFIDIVTVLLRKNSYISLSRRQTRFTPYEYFITLFHFHSTFLHFSRRLRNYQRKIIHSELRLRNILPRPT